MTPPAYYHAVHPSPFADDCPDCAGYAAEAANPKRRRRWLPLAVALVAAGVLALAVSK